MRQDYSEFLRRDTEVVVVGPEGKKQFNEYWEENDLPFIGLPNPDHSVLKRFGQEIKLFKLGRMPAQVLVDRQGTVRFAHYGNSMSDIPSNQEILEQVEALSGEPVEG